MAVSASRMSLWVNGEWELADFRILAERLFFFFHNPSGEGTDCTVPNCSSSPSLTVIYLLAAVYSSAVANTVVKRRVAPIGGSGRHPHLYIFLRIFLAVLRSGLGCSIDN